MSTEEIFQEALHMASVYAIGTDKAKWTDWSPNARDDFWSMALDNLETPRIAMPDEFMSRDDKC